MTFLLDINVLISLAWPNHVLHEAAREWFDGLGGDRWATTPITEAGFVRISCSPAVIEPLSPSEAIGLLGTMRAAPGHIFLADDVAGVVGDWLPTATVAVSSQVTDAHLLALASRHKARLATFDRGIRRIAGDTPNLLLIPAG